MRNPIRKVAFVITATDHGTMILNRFDYHLVAANKAYGVGFSLLEGASFNPDEVDLVLTLLDLRRKYFGDGVVAIDCGANVGVHSIEWAKRMTGWGSVVAIESQERIYYALAGNIAINNCFNCRAIHAAVDTRVGMMKVPRPDYTRAGSFGSLEMKKRESTEFIGQPIDYSEANMVDIHTMTIDSLALPRVDVVKIDVEGMELDVLEGAARCLKDQHPIILVESIKTDKNKLRSRLTELGYSLFEIGMNLLAIHNSDSSLKHIGNK